MESNAVALRLKELETLERITEKIGNISIYDVLDSVLDVNNIVAVKGLDRLAGSDRWSGPFLNSVGNTLWPLSAGLNLVEIIFQQ